MDLGLWSGWEPIVSVLIVGPFAFFGVVALLRISGKRSLSKLNMFDFVVTVAMGTILGAAFTGTVSLVHGVVAFGVLLAVQWLATYGTSHSDAVKNILMSEATLLYKDGRFYHEAMKRERLTETELRGSARDSSIGGLDRVAAMILEGDGTVSVVPKDQAGDGGIIPDAPPDAGG